MSHSTGVSDSYYRPSEKDLVEDYLKAVPLLTINSEKLALQKQVAELTEKSKEENYIIKGKFEEQIQNMKGKYDSDIALLKDAIYDMQQLLKDPEKLAEMSKFANREIV